MDRHKKAYKEIFELLNRHKDVIVFDIDSLKIKSDLHLFGVELVEKYGFNLNPKCIHSNDYQKFNNNLIIGFWDGTRRKISWSDDGTQPKDELLLCISYPTGPYIFGDDYPEELFHKLFMEIKSYKPKYTDTHNNSIYFSMDNASKIFNEYDDILKRYYKKNKEDAKKREIKKLKEDLANLENK